MSNIVDAKMDPRFGNWGIRIKDHKEELYNSINNENSLSIGRDTEFSTTVAELIIGLMIVSMRGLDNFIINQKNKNTMVHVVSTNPFDYIDRFCSNLNMDIDFKYICQFIVFNAIRMDILDDNTPPSIAAGSIFLISTILGLGINKNMVHNATKISAVTISKCFKKLNAYREILFPKAAIENYNIQFTDKSVDKKKQYRKKTTKNNINNVITI